MNSSELKELLRATTAFSILSDRELDHLADRFELVYCALGQDVVRAGSEPEAFPTSQLLADFKPAEPSQRH